MKSNTFLNAIIRRKKLRFLYELEEVILEPYYISKNRDGSKVLFGRTASSNEIRTFRYSKIFNIRTLDSSRFSPIIPILPIAS